MCTTPQNFSELFQKTLGFVAWKGRIIAYKSYPQAMWIALWTVSPQEAQCSPQSFSFLASGRDIRRLGSTMRYVAGFPRVFHTPPTHQIYSIYANQLFAPF